MSDKADAVETKQGYVKIKGRWWRCTDADIPEPLRQQLVNALMLARRQVGIAKRSDDGVAEKLARDRVHAAKTALGERGPKWWLPMTESDLRLRMIASLLSLLEQRGLEKSVCPSEVARIMRGKKWRPLLSFVRAESTILSERGMLAILQSGESVSPAFKGPIRIAQGPSFNTLWPMLKV